MFRNNYDNDSVTLYAHVPDARCNSCQSNEQPRGWPALDSSNPDDIC